MGATRWRSGSLGDVRGRRRRRPRRPQGLRVLLADRRLPRRAVSRTRSRPAYVSNAFVALGVYFPRRDPRQLRAPERRARATRCSPTLPPGSATPTRSTILARLYLDGHGVTKKPAHSRRAGSTLAADKGHIPAQAVLGHLLSPAKASRRQRALAAEWWLTLRPRRRRSEPVDWVAELYDKAVGRAPPSEKRPRPGRHSPIFGAPTCKTEPTERLPPQAGARSFAQQRGRANVGSQSRSARVTAEPMKAGEDAARLN